MISAALSQAAVLALTASMLSFSPTLAAPTAVPSIRPAAVPAATTTTTAQTARTTSLACTSAVTSPFAQTQGQSSAPMCVRDQWIYDLPATSSPDTVRRTETHWGSTNALKEYREGDTVTYEAEYTGELGKAGQEDNDWHVLWQLHGPFGNTWRAPAMGINVRHGELRLGGGSGHPDHDWSKRNYEWIYKIGTWTDNKPVRVKVQTYLSSDPAKGWVSAWVNGQQVLDKVIPTSYSGKLRPGTYYPGMSYVVSRTGLYRGSQGAVVPTYRQAITAQVFRAG